MTTVAPGEPFAYNDPTMPTVAQPASVPPGMFGMNQAQYGGGYGMNQPQYGGAVPITMHPGVAVNLQSTLPVNVLCQMSSLPVDVKCPFCKAQTTTTIEKLTGGRAYITAFAFTCMGCCCLLPCMWESLKDTVHYCGNCHMELGRYIPRGGGGGGRRRRGRRR